MCYNEKRNDSVYQFTHNNNDSVIGQLQSFDNWKIDVLSI